jgi:membrane-associated PAP2 superfamily phosphatase
VALILIGLWEFSGLDLALVRLFATADGFPLRDAFVTSELLHVGARRLAAVAFLLQLVDAIWPQVAGPSRLERAKWLAVTVGCIVLIPAIKRFSATSCPWDLLEFGGTVPYVAHWILTTVDGGPGHCFPSGHAVSGFAFFPLCFLWRQHRPGLARVALAAVVVLGTVFGAAQMIRGAHFASHTFWTAWLCWTICAISAHSNQARFGSRCDPDRRN